MDLIISKNPATGEAVFKQESVGVENVIQALRIARVTQREQWARLTFEQRSVFLKRAKVYMLSHMDEIAQAISKNNGKPLVEALAAEVVPVIQTLSFAIKRAKKILRDKKIPIGLVLPTKKAFISYEPLGVIGIISPWNYPLSTPMSEVILSLISGNAVLLKPSDVTGLVNVQIQKIVDSMQLPKGLFTMIHGRGDVGAALAKSGVDRIIVTGSVGTGQKVMAAASENLTPVTLELGGKDCMIVLEDADLEVSTSAAVVGCFYNTGQTCCSVERLLVHESISEKFLSKFSEKISKLRTGESRNFDNDLGPITFEGQKKTYFNQLQDHLKNNEKTLFGSTTFDGRSNFMSPLVVQTQENRDFWKEETFGPVVAFKTFKTDAEAVETGNNTGFGLTALIWSKNTQRARDLARCLNTGTVVINDGPFTNAVPVLPWGGQGLSGFGKVHGEMGLKELCRSKVITYDSVGQQKQFWWYPYSQSQYDFFKNYVGLFESTGFFNKIKIIFQLIKNFRRMGPRL